MDNVSQPLPEKEDRHYPLPRLQAILEAAVDGFITIDEHGLIEYANPATCKIFGYEESELIGQNIHILMPSPDREKHDGYIQNYLTTGVKKIIGLGREVVGRRKDGSSFPFWLSVSEAPLEGRRLFTGVVHDISEQKRSEETARRIQTDLENRLGERNERLSELVNKLLITSRRFELEGQERKAAQNALKMVETELRAALQKEKELGELKSRFVTMASHEFRTPLTTILSSADLMASYKTTEDQSNRERHHQKIKKAVDNLNAILNDFLSLSRLEEGRVELEYEEFVLQDFCRHVLEEERGTLKTGQTLIYEDLTQGAAVVRLDKKILRMTLNNLISNASKYSEADQKIICRITGKPLAISFCDNGIGVPDADKPYMFDRFFRASNAANIKGTGLGLNIVRRYIELMNGVLSFESTEGKGSVFTISF